MERERLAEEAGVSVRLITRLEYKDGLTFGILQPLGLVEKALQRARVRLEDGRVALRQEAYSVLAGPVE